MKNLTAVLISFLRPEYTFECIRTLHKEYKDIKILVAENGQYNKELHEYIHARGGRYFLMPFDSGVCYARNRLVELADTEYILVGDDDFYYNKEAKVREMLKFLRGNKDFDLIGGRIRERGKILDYQGFINIYPDHFEYKKMNPEHNLYDIPSRLVYQKCDITFNFFVARRESIIGIPWDEKIKVAYEHSDWFISMMKAKRSVAYTPDAIVIHKPDHIVIKNENDYKYYRHRKTDQARFFDKHKVDYSIGFRGVKSNFRKEVKLAKHKYYTKRTMCYDGRSYNAGDIITTKRPTDDMVPLM